MLQHLIILNYKSIKEVQMSCRKVNIIIGHPNTGKSNILEALGLFSLYNNECKITELARFQSMHNLFFEHAVHEPVHILTDKHRMRISLRQQFEVLIETQNGTTTRNHELYYDVLGKLINTDPHYNSPINLYRFAPASIFPSRRLKNLKPPHGDNLVMMLIKHEELREEASRIFEQYGYQLAIDATRQSIAVQKITNNLLFSHPYELASRLMQRYIFHLAAIESNKDSIIVFEEPETYASSEFNERIADKITSDKKNNQYFFSTHNSKLLIELLKRMPHEDIKIYITGYDNYRTTVRAMKDTAYANIVDKSINQIFNLESTIEEIVSHDTLEKIKHTKPISSSEV